uniref:Glyoxalase domain-containing protein n=1 Tax=Leptobrachium leishanense TaxID=445787 RepID=A0A8C5LYF1_9ANUR
LLLRHEEFEGCKATFNGPYDGKWSKTMIGSIDKHFVVELTYNYGVGEYRLGNDFKGITLQSSQAIANARQLKWPLAEVLSGLFEVAAPGGYKFYLDDKDQPKTDPVKKVTLAVSNLQTSISYWSGLLGMTIYDKEDTKKNDLLGYADNQCKLDLQDISGPVDHGTAFGRIAFKILTPLVSLDTPGKATVQVVILADPDGHEISFVGAEAFEELSQTDPNANDLLNDAMASDKSEEWFAKGKMQKPSA